MGASGPGKRYETTRKFNSSRSANHSHHLADSFPDPWGRAPRGRLFGWFVEELLLSVGGAVLLRRVVIVMLLPGTPGLDLRQAVSKDLFCPALVRTLRQVYAVPPYENSLWWILPS